MLQAFQRRGRLARVSLVLADWYLWALLFPAIAWLSVRFPVERGVWERRLALHLAAG